MLSSAFFLNDKRFLGGVEGSPESNRNPKFLEANHQARAIAQARLKNLPAMPILFSCRPWPMAWSPITTP